MGINIAKKPFKKGDIIIYTIIVVVAITLFLVGSLNTKPRQYISVLLNGKEIFTADLENRSYNILSEEITLIDKDTFKVETGKGYNIFYIDWQNKDVRVTQSNCSTSHDCTYMSLKNGDIICVPHGLVIKVYGKVPEPVIG